MLCSFLQLARNCRASVWPRNYLGNRSTTVSGKTCQRWDSLSHHKHRFTTIEFFFPDISLREASNYCRNPYGTEGGPWCFGNGSDYCEYCDIPVCGKQTLGERERERDRERQRETERETESSTSASTFTFLSAAWISTDCLMILYVTIAVIFYRHY